MKQGLGDGRTDWEGRGERVDTLGLRVKTCGYVFQDECLSSGSASHLNLKEVTHGLLILIADVLGSPRMQEVHKLPALGSF